MNTTAAGLGADGPGDVIAAHVGQADVDDGNVRGMLPRFLDSRPAVLARRLRVRGRELLVRGAQPQVQALIKHVGLHRLPAVRFEPSPAFA